MSEFGFLEMPDAPAYRLAAAKVPVCVLAEPGGVDPSNDIREGLVDVDIDVADGRIVAIHKRGSAAAYSATIDLDGSLVLPCFTDLHTHIDKGHIWPRMKNPGNNRAGALSSVQADREARWSHADVAARMDFSLRSAFAHGTARLRTHLDSLPLQAPISWPVFAEMRERWAGRIDLQAVSILPSTELRGPFLEQLMGIVADHGGIFGCVVMMSPDMDEILDRIFILARRHDLALDFHVDENGDPTSIGLRHIAEATMRHGYEGRVTAGHCCSLAVQSEAEAARTIAAVAKAQINIVSLPLCNLFLQGRRVASGGGSRTPRWRGVTLLHELNAAGVPVSVASDNTRDPFYGYGDLDMLEVFREAVRIGHLDLPFAQWPCAVTTNPARVMGADLGQGLRAGQLADLVICEGRAFHEVLSRPEAQRVVLRSGRAIDRKLPSYRELDPLMNGR